MAVLLNGIDVKIVASENADKFMSSPDYTSVINPSTGEASHQDSGSIRLCVHFWILLTNDLDVPGQ